MSKEMHAIFLWQGFCRKGEAHSDTQGQIGLVSNVASYAKILHESCEALWLRDANRWMGVYEYEVTEEIGAWLREQSEDGFVAALIFNAELERREQLFIKQGGK